MTTPENKVKSRVRNLLTLMHAYQFPVQSAGMGEAGHPDRVACVHGAFVGIECKADSTRHPTDLQAARLNALIAAGGLAFVVDADNFDTFSKFFQELFAAGVTPGQRAEMWLSRDTTKHSWWR